MTASTTRFQACALGLAALAAAFLPAVRAMPTETGRILLDDGLLLAVKLLAVWACFARAPRAGRAAWSWRWLGSAFLVSALGLIIFGVLQLGFGVSFPFPAPSDIAFLAIVPFMLAALLSWPHAPERFTTRLRTALDGLLIATAALFLAWPFCIAPVLQDSALSLLGQVVGLAYPLGFVATLAALLFLGGRSPGMFRGPFLLAGLSVAVLTGANMGYFWLVAEGRYRTGHPLDLLFFVGFGLGALAALAPRHLTEDAPVPSFRRPRYRLALPYLPFLACLAMGLWIHAERPDLFGEALVVMGFILCVLLVARQILALLDVEAIAVGLERRVAERTEELMRSREEVEKARRLQELSGLAAGVAHDFKNLLGAGLNHLEVIQAQGGLDPTQQSQLEAALAPLDRAASLARQLLHLRAGAEGRTDRFDLAAWLRAQEAHWRSLLPEGVALDLAPQPCGEARFDASQLERVIQNLLINASEAMPGGGRITLTCRPGEGEILIEVSDQGPGLGPEQKTRLFEPFFTTKANGTGLGLATAWATLRRGGGSIEGLDAPGGGALFRLHLPQG